MSGRRYDDAYYAELLYRLLPALYRGRDREGELKAFLGLFGHEIARLRANIDQLWRDFYIDSCQDWVIPCIGELVGADILFNEGARNRADVKNTIGWRRRKGTLAGLEDVAAVTADRGAHAVEMFERLVWAQNVNHVRRHAIHAVDLAAASRLARLGTPFDPACRSVDLRPADHRAGWHRIRTAAVHLWYIPSLPWTGATPAALDPARYRFHPLGLDTPLHAGGDRGDACLGATDPAADGPDICAPHADHVPIRGRDFHDHPLRYFGQPPGFTVYEDGIPLCATAHTVESRSNAPCTDFGELAAERGLLVADPGLFTGLGAFRIEAVRLAAQTVLVDGAPVAVPYSPTVAFDAQFTVAGAQGGIDTGTFAYTKGTAYQPGAPVYHQPVTLLRIERLGADANFPECEVILRNDRGAALLVFLPALAGLVAGQPVHLYAADDGSTYFARGAHDAGAPDRNPDASIFGAYLPRHLARHALGQARPRPGVRPVAHRRAVYRRLCCWDQPPPRPLEPGDVAFDPERGRFRFPAGEEPAGELTVDFRFALTGEVGAGPFDRGTLPAPTLTVGQGADADHASIQDAIDAAPDGGAVPVVIEIADSRTYDEALSIDGRSFPGGLVLQARALAAPVLRAPGGNALTVTAGSAVARLVLDGLVVAGGDVVVNGDVPQLAFRFCTLVPDSVILDFDPAAPARLEIENGIVGPVTAAANVEAVRIRDTVVQHPAATMVHPEAHTALTAAHAVAIERTTVIGAIAAGTLEASNSILFGSAAIGDPASSCLRYSRIHADPGPVSAFRCTTAFPVFVSIRYGRPGYAHLHPNTAAAVRSGGEEGGEMGAFYRAGNPWRTQNVRRKLEEYAPAGIEAVVIPVVPELR
ncbi:MAG TPA: hypothetical protein VF188_01520 [Longimicrobiales bacterium]